MRYGRAQFRSGRALLAIAVLLPFIAVGPRDAAAQDEQSVSARIRSLLEGRADDTQTFYQARGFRPAWLEPDRRRAAGLIRVLRAADAEALPPARYDVERIAALAHAGAGTDNVARLDVLLTDAFLRYARDVSFGRLDPRAVHSGWKRAPRTLDPAAFLERVLAADDFTRAMSTLAPADPAYVRMRAALAEYRAVAANGGWPRVPGVRLEQGDTADAVSALRRRLAAEDRGTTVGSPLFDADLTARVIVFQKRHGLEPDGIVGRRTHAELAVSAAQRVHQIALNMERLRWAAPTTDSLRIEVSIPEFELRALRGADIVMQMRVIGGLRSWPTPIFDATVEALTINPPWNVPRRIATLEILPAIKRNPLYLAAHEMQVLASNGSIVDPASIDWKNVTARTFDYRFRQVPGPANPLGVVKFVLPNPYDVYLHDTPSKSLFARADRSSSHGCVRLENALDLAILVLDGSGWTPESLLDAVAQRTERQVGLARRVPVSIRYVTAWVEESGEVHFREDVYGHDAALDRLLGDSAAAERPVESASACGG